MAKFVQLFSVLLLLICVSWVDGHFGGVQELKIQKRIVGGLSAAENEFPYQVSLRIKSKDKYFCGGAIISDFYILSHCFYRKPKQATLFVAVAGIYHVDQQGVRLELSQLKFHEKFDPILKLNDIALIRTVKKIPFSDAIAPIALPTHGNIPSGSKVTVMGWGIIKKPQHFMDLYLNRVHSTSLQFLESNTIDLEQCRILFEPLKETDFFHPRLLTEGLNDNIICVRAESTFGACIDDSGGPVVADGTLIGIISWSEGCARGFPDVHTNVFNFVDWIKESMDELEGHL